MKPTPHWFLFCGVRFEATSGTPYERDRALQTFAEMLGPLKPLSEDEREKMLSQIPKEDIEAGEADVAAGRTVSIADVLEWTDEPADAEVEAAVDAYDTATGRYTACLSEGQTSGTLAEDCQRDWLAARAALLALVRRGGAKARVQELRNRIKHTSAPAACLDPTTPVVGRVDVLEWIDELLGEAPGAAVAPSEAEQDIAIIRRTFGITDAMLEQDSIHTWLSRHVVREMEKAKPAAARDGERERAVEAAVDVKAELLGAAKREYASAGVLVSLTGPATPVVSLKWLEWKLGKLALAAPAPPVEEGKLRELLNAWCVAYGKALCPPPGSTDSFGDGMRAAKDQVRALLAAPPKREGGEPQGGAS